MKISEKHPFILLLILFFVPLSMSMFLFIWSVTEITGKFSEPSFSRFFPLKYLLIKLI